MENQINIAMVNITYTWKFLYLLVILLRIYMDAKTDDKLKFHAHTASVTAKANSILVFIFTDKNVFTVYAYH